MFLAPVLTVIRASGFGSAFGVAALLIGSCAVLPNESDTLRIKRVEEAVLPMARVALEAEQTETAKRLYLRLLEVDPNSVTARMGLGDIAVASRDSAEAARWYAAAVAHATRADERHTALLAHGRAALAGGELKAARKSFSRLTSQRENAPTQSVAWGLNGLGLVALLEGDIRAAIRLMEQAVLLAPEENRLSENLSRALDLSAGTAPEPTSADQVRDMMVAPDSATLRDGQNPTGTPRATPPVEEDLVEDRKREEPVREADRTRRVDEREEPHPENNGPGADVRRIDRSELRPYAIKVGGEFYVRIGAYGIQSDARAVASELGRVTTELVDVVEFGMGDGRNAVRLYRVLVGPIASEAGLVELVATLEEMGYGAARVPTSVASESEESAAPKPAPSTGQRSAGPELVEVFLEPAADETTTSTQETQPAPKPEPEDANARSGSDEKVSEADIDVASTEVADPAASDPVTAGDDAGPTPRVGDTDVASRGVASEVRAAPSPGPEQQVAVATFAEVVPSSENLDPQGGGSTPRDIAGNGVQHPEALPQFLQVGAYTVRSTAEKLAAEVGSVARASVRVVEAELANGETMYRVQVGPIGSREMMTELSQMLISGGYGTVRILPESAATDALEEALPTPPPPWHAPERRVRAFIVHEESGRLLQMGAYAVRSTANTLASQLRLVTSEPVFVAKALNDDGDALYRVRIGPIASDASLATLLDALRSSYGSGWVLPSMEMDTRRTAFVVHEGSERFLQMGAYAARSAANALISELRGEIDGQLRITQVLRSGGEPIYRVRIGPIASDESLLALVGMVESLGFVVD